MIENLFFITGARISRALGKPSLPRMMSYNVTNRCNAKCLMCEIHSWDTSAENELTADGFDNFISDPLLKGLEVVRITGGEPFMRKDLPDIYASIRERTRAAIVYVTTNGSFPERAAALVEEAGQGDRPRLHMLVSIDALDDTHDRLRGVEGIKEKAVRTITQLAEMKKEYDFYAGINQTVMPETLQWIDPVNELAETLGVGHHLFLGAHFHEGKRMDGQNPTKSEMSFRPQGGMTAGQMEEFYRKHRRLKDRGAAVRQREGYAGALLREISEEYLNEGGRNRAIEGRSYPKPSCMAMFSHFRLSPEGRIFSCSAFRKYSAGNVNNRSFYEIWHGEKADDIREKVTDCQGCWIECDINPSIFFSGDVIPWFLKRAFTDPRFRKNYLLRPRF